MKDKDSSYAIPVAIVIAGVIVAGATWTEKQPKSREPTPRGLESLKARSIKQEKSFVLEWNGMGSKIIESGVLDSEKFLSLYSGRDRVLAKQMLQPNTNSVEINQESAPIILNLLWALGLGQKSAILDTGEMKDPTYGGAGKFASTGGWTIAVSEAMEHYSMHGFVTLTSEQEALVKRMVKGIYRPCCDNSTHFPDCNHGMAMLGLMQLLASEGATESDLYSIALQVNAYWFPSQYETIASYLESKGLVFRDVDPKTVLAKEFSSASGYQAVLATGQSEAPSNGGGCSV